MPAGGLRHSPRRLSTSAANAAPAAGQAPGGRFRRQRELFGWLGPHFIIDQTYLMASAREDLADDTFRTYWLWLGGTLLVVWTSSIALGVLLGPALGIVAGAVAGVLAVLRFGSGE